MSYEYEDREEGYGGRVLWGRFAFWAAVIVLAFVLGRCSADDGVSQAELDQTRAELTEMASDNMMLRNELEAVSSGGLGTMPQAAASPDASDAADDGAADAGGQDSAAGPGSQPDAGADSAPEGEGQRYTVQPGDTVNSIAQQFYGDLTNTALIIEANDIDDVDQLQAGRELLIPPAPSG